MNRLVKTLAIALLSVAMVGCSESDPVEKKINKLLAQMTLEEKIGQLNQVTAYDTDAMCAEAAAGTFGSTLNLVDPVEINKIQRAAVENSRLGIPLIFARDVIHGFHTIFPIPLGQAASFDPTIVEEGARHAAREAVASGVRWTFSPMVDISRDSRWGRIAESFGEDPYLTSELAVAMLNGYQNNEKPLAACAKHFVGYGASEGGLDYSPVHITERELRNYYLPPFEALAKAGCMTLMPSFNDNDGIPSAGNKFLLRDVLRDEWGWDGCVVSDWGSVGGMIAHGFAADNREAAKRGITAGTDVDMMAYAYITELKGLVESGEVDEAVIDESVRNILRLKFRLGLFENPYVDEENYQAAFYTPEALEAARVAAVESAVLLKND
ncbi:MAG: glycosyl hydrolase, partial [Tidjanibacter sp.]|nr:glycosyl hydrolase [Tidjanibacter sp.]